MLQTLPSRRALLGVALLLGAAGARASIQSVSFVAPAFRPVETAPTQASQAELQVTLDATPSRYRLDVFRVGGPAARVATRSVEHPQAAGSPAVHAVLVPLQEGGQTFTVRAVDENQPQYALSSGATPTITRDLGNTASTVHLDHIVPVERVTSRTTCDLVYTIHGAAETYAVEVERNGLIIQLDPGIGRGEQTLTGVPMLEGENFFRVRVRATDALSSDPAVTSNPLRIIRDTTPPTLTNVVVGNPPLPTTQAVVNIQGDTEGFALITVEDGDGNSWSKRADQLGNFSLSGIVLPLTLPGPTTTIFQVTARDLAGNVSTTVALPATRTAGTPRFEFLRLLPFDGTHVQPDVAVQHYGMPGFEAGPYEIRFIAQADGDAPLLEEVLPVLGDTTPFQKDTILVADPDTPGADVPWSFRATVESTAGASAEHVLGTVILDVADPAPVVLLDADFDAVPTFSSRTFTMEGAAERSSRVQWVGFNGVEFLPTNLVDTDPTPLAPGGEFRSVVDMTGLGDGDYSVLSTVIATSGRTSQQSQRNVPFVLDRSQPEIEVLSVDDVDSALGRDNFRRANQLVKLTVRVDEYMPEPPELMVSQQGADGLRAVFDAAPVAGRVFDYLFVTDASRDHDGPVEVVAVGGADRAGNAIVREWRFPRAFVVDTRAPLVDSLRTSPRDGSLITSAPAPLRVTLVEPSDSAEPSSGPDPGNSTIRVLGPLEVTPTRLHPGRLDQFDSHTLEYRADPGTFDVEGTYQVEVEAADRAGNVTTHVLIYTLDSTPPEKDFVLETFPPAGASVSATGLPTDAAGRHWVGARFDVTSPDELDLGRSTVELRSFCPVPFPIEATLSTTAPDRRVLTLEENLAADGSDDGLYTILVRAADPAGNLQSPVAASFVYDNLPPVVLDGNQLSFPGSPIPTDRGVFPLDEDIVRGPLREVSAVVQDAVAGSGFTGSGVKVDATTGSRIELTLTGAHPTTTAPVGWSTASSGVTTLRFQELSEPELSPCFLDLRRRRLMLELFTDPVTGDPDGLPADGSFDGEWEMTVVPVDPAGNQGTAVRTRFTYDTVRPVVELDLVLNDRVYTGNRLTVHGQARDNDKGPRDHGQGLRTVQVRLEGQSPVPLTTNHVLLDFFDATLTPDPRLAEAETWIPWRVDRRIPAYEGRARLIVRAEDMAGNERFLVRELVLDVDPLPAPRLRLPEHRACRPGAVTRFEWEHVDGASSYDLVITDDAGNDRVHARDFPYRYADVNLSSFEPGEYTWTVHAVDTGGTRGEPAYRRTFRLDTALPEVDRVFPFAGVIPDAHAGDRVGAQIRIGVTFSEEMDVSQPPTVLLDPADPLTPTTTVRQLEYDGREWRGVVDVPASPDAPDVNGLGTVILRDAVDCAGNPITETRVAFEVDIGPWWEVRAFANPVLERELIFYFRARTSRIGPLEQVADTPHVHVAQQGAASPRWMSLRRFSPSIFYGTYEVDRTLPGTATIQVVGTDPQGNTAPRVLSFSVAALMRADRNEIRFSSGALTVSLPARAVARDRVVTILPPRLDAADMGPERPDDPPLEELELVRRLDRLVPGRIELERPGRLRLALSGLGLASAEASRGLGLFVRKGEGFEFVSGAVEGGRLEAQVGELSTYYLMRDLTPPRLDPERAEHDDARGRVVRLPLADRGAGVDVASLRARLGTRTLPVRFLRSREILEVELPRDAGGEEALTVEVRDRLGNVARADMALGAAGAPVLLEATAYPNPARSRSRVRYRLAADGRDAVLVLHDAVGRRVRVLRGPARAGNNEITWDLRDRRGRGVARGVYLAVLTVRGSAGEQTRRRLKLAVLR